jgi:hypothetical protein
MYCSHEMGILEKVENGYKYTSNAENEQMLLEKGFLDHSEYSLWFSYGRENKVLFADFDEFLAEVQRRDILERAGITPADSRWEKLVKLSKLTWYPRGFYVQVLEGETKQDSP